MKFDDFSFFYYDSDQMKLHFEDPVSFNWATFTVIKIEIKCQKLHVWKTYYLLSRPL